MNQKNIQRIFLEIIGRLLQLIFAVYAYIPIFIGILAPMVFLIPIFYLTGIVWINPGIWLSAYYLVNPDESFLLLGLELLIFGVGSALIIMALFQLAKGKKQGEKIVQEGIYRYIRHPQHLGLMIMTLPFALYIPGVNDLGIRMGDLVAWSCFIFLMIIYSDLEEIKLKKRLPTEFAMYQATTGFLFPKSIQIKPIQSLQNIKEKVYLRYAVLLVGFISYLLIFEFCVLILKDMRILVAFK